MGTHNSRFHHEFTIEQGLYYGIVDKLILYTNLNTF